jgi:hypothetical protein
MLVSPLRSASIALLALLAFTPPAAAADAAAEARAKAFAALPDWSGVWMGTGTLFEQRPGGGTNPNADRTLRDYPPYKPEWEAGYSKFLEEVVRPGKYLDPLTLSYPTGMLRTMAPARGLQFVVRPEMVWIIHERPDIRYIYTDGRPFPPPDELWPTFEGYSIGHWEGDTLVVETVSMMGGVPIDRTGAVLSDKARVVERIRKIDERTMTDEITITDPVALTRPWVVTRRYTKRNERYPRVESVSSLENQRNPIVGGETKILVGEQTPDSSSPYGEDIRPFAVPRMPQQ